MSEDTEGQAAAAIQRYVKGYRAHPETGAELDWLAEANRAALTEEPCAWPAVSREAPRG